jgi:hypothetical protein
VGRLPRRLASRNDDDARSRRRGLGKGIRGRWAMAGRALKRGFRDAIMVDYGLWRMR